MLADKETYENGDVILDVYRTGECFLTIDHFGMYVTDSQMVQICDLLEAYLGEKNYLRKGTEQYERYERLYGDRRD